MVDPLDPNKELTKEKKKKLHPKKQTIPVRCKGTRSLMRRDSGVGDSRVTQRYVVGLSARHFYTCGGEIKRYRFPNEVSGGGEMGSESSDGSSVILPLRMILTHHAWC